ncbi:MAG: helix-turn-helix transcriptional regulator [Christensenellaceae bacterium]|nr:helix-turn-helix transcriptional regulator [Christensenellaceae bacterium]
MDLIKIGKYIAGKRKELALTQKQLAEKLGMSDKSVSKWERGVCLPDVSVYAELCDILGISINEFLAGEDIPKENMIRKSEENIIGVTKDSKKKQNRLKILVCSLLILTVLTVSFISIMAYQKWKPVNIIKPVDSNSIEMQTARLLAGPEGLHMYRFTTTDAYRSLKITVSEYHAGKLMNQENSILGFDGIASPKNGDILIVPDFKNFTVKLIVSADGSKYSAEFPILEDVPERMYYGRSATEMREETAIRYDEEQALAALIYDNDQMRVLDLYDLMDGKTDALAENDYVYYFSFAFCKE